MMPEARECGRQNKIFIHYTLEYWQQLIQKQDKKPWHKDGNLAFGLDSEHEEWTTHMKQWFSAQSWRLSEGMDVSRD